MINYTKPLTKSTVLTKRGHFYFINGIRSRTLVRDIHDLYVTTRVANNILRMNTSSSITFHEFFLPDIYFTLKKLINSPGGLMAKQSIKMILKLLETETWLKPLSNIPKSNYKLLSHMTYKPLEHQMDFLDNIHYRKDQFQLKGGMLSAAVGSGKTLMSIFAAELLESQAILVISPLNAVNRVWEATIKSAYKDMPNYWLSNSGYRVPTTPVKFYVCHYDYLNKLVDQMHLIPNKKLMIIVDESHNFNELKAARTVKLTDMVKHLNPNYSLLMSGTPVKAMALETIPLFRIIDPLFDNTAEDSFRAVYKGNTDGAAEILQNRLGLVSFNVAKSELKLAEPITEYKELVLPNGDYFTLDAIRERMKVYILKQKNYYASRREADLKEFTRCVSEHELTLAKPQEKLYKEYKDNLSRVMSTRNTWLVASRMVFCNMYEKEHLIPSLSKESGKVFKEIKAAVKYPHLKIMGECLGNVLGKARQECYIAMVHEIDFDAIIESTEKKVVIFTSYVAIADEVIKILQHKYSPMGVYGEYVGDLNATVKAFFDNPAINPLIATYMSLSTAVPLIVADTMILIDLPWRVGTLEQAIGRVHRLGNTGNTYVFKFGLDTDGQPNVVSRSADILVWARDEVEAITGIKSPIELTETNISTEDYGCTYDLPYLKW